MFPKAEDPPTKLLKEPKLKLLANGETVKMTDKGNGHGLGTTHVDQSKLYCRQNKSGIFNCSNQTYDHVPRSTLNCSFFVKWWKVQIHINDPQPHAPHPNKKKVSF